jgi:hypothetical protein
VNSISYLHIHYITNNSYARKYWNLHITGIHDQLNWFLYHHIYLWITNFENFDTIFGLDQRTYRDNRGQIVAGVKRTDVRNNLPSSKRFISKGSRWERLRERERERDWLERWIKFSHWMLPTTKRGPNLIPSRAASLSVDLWVSVGNYFTFHIISLNEKRIPIVN